ncbi:TlpA family protein disulfide reductase [Pedobacter chinensis]|uniref:TlpA family protein disulfide reductase n=1 Tax=Pedobacter chinensis TaxID=2282421 RepID=A0A369Q047_9SPHI|nr:TlpA disulfide reductase family protein [Pedobacter chinensis]RDC58263.1 TlpA family protein disulfide reductase [Pedobacter chinensis]
MKINLSFLILCLLFTDTVFAKEKIDAEHVLRKTSKTLNELKSISYNSYREINNFKDNYFAQNSGASYFEYGFTAENKVIRFQLHSDNTLQVYNGTEYFILDQKEKTIELERKSIKQLSGLSLLYNSITTIRLALPMLLKDPGIPKSLKDTLIENKIYYLVKFELNRKSIDFPNGFSSFDSEVIKYYKLIIDKETSLPYMIFDGNSISKDEYYTKTIFSNIDVNPKLPTKNSWFYSSYTDYETKKKIIQKPMVTIGDILPDWSLPRYGSSNLEKVRSDDLKGKIILMEFWIKNCGYCMLAFPEIKELEEKYGNQIEILSVNAYDKKEEVDFFYKREKPGYKMLYDGEKFANDLGIYAYPATIMLDKKGEVIYSSKGFNKEETEQAIKKALQSNL